MKCEVCGQPDPKFGRVCGAECDRVLGTAEDPAPVIVMLLAVIAVAGMIVAAVLR